MNSPQHPRIIVIGLGYVGLPLAVALARHFDVVGFDIDEGRVAELQEGHDRTSEVDREVLAATSLTVTSNQSDARSADVYIITVPTPVDSDNRPDLGALDGACDTLAQLIDPAHRPTVVFESTVYPGVTEDHCGPRIERSSAGLRRGLDFRLGYSPERINPGDKVHRVETITKVIAGEDQEVLDQLTEIYGAINGGNIFRAASIRAAEAAKVIENAQRDINIAFMNEVAQIFSTLGVPVRDVLEAARTKWNFLPFEPGLVGGHCIGVDPYYLAHAARENGHDPRVILAGRSINDGMAAWVADRLHERRGRPGRVLVLGVTFKENVPDLRNSKVVDMVRRLEALGHDVAVSDPLADPSAARAEHGIDLVPTADVGPVDLLIGAVVHDEYREMGADALRALLADGGLLADLKDMWSAIDLGETERWTL